MKTALKAALATLALAAAAPAAAQYSNDLGTPAPAAPYRFEAREHVARVNLGVGLYNSGWYNCYYYYGYYSCTSGSYTSYVPFEVGAQVDIGLGRNHALSLGVLVGSGSVNFTYFDGFVNRSTSRSVTLWEPTVDYVARYGPATLDTRGRFRIGGGVYLGPNGGSGAAIRIGGGASILNTHRVGLGVDFVFEGGSYQGYWIGGLQLLVSPEFHF